MRSLLLLLTLSGSLGGATFTCSLFVGSTPIPAVTIATSCSASTPGFGSAISASSGPGYVGAGGSSFGSNLSAMASMIDSITFSGGSGEGIFMYHVASNCSTSAGSCSGTGSGIHFVTFTYGAPIPLSLSLWNTDNINHPPAMLGVSITINYMAVLKTEVITSDVDLFQGKLSVPGVSYTTESGGSYNLIAAPNPEPGTFLLVFVAGVGGLAKLLKLKGKTLASLGSSRFSKTG